MDNYTNFSLCDLDDVKLLLQEQLGLENLKEVDALLQQQLELHFPPNVKSGLRKAKKAVFESMCKAEGVTFKPSLPECWKQLERWWKVFADLGTDDQRLPGVMKLSKIVEHDRKYLAMATYEREKGVPWALLH